MTVQLYEVTFIGSHTVTRDAAPQLDYPPVWRDENLDGDADDWGTIAGTSFPADVRAPLCYTKDEEIKVSTVKFKVTPANAIRPTAKVYGRLGGTQIDAFTTVGNLSYDGTGTILTANITGFAGSFSHIAHTADYPIDWRIDAGTTTYDAGTSKNPVHWVLLAPTGNFTLYFSLIDIGCRMAEGEDGSDLNAIADKIFAEFADLEVFRASDVLEDVNPDAMTYWYDWWTVGPDIPDLLATGDGKCGAWANLFTRCMHAVGVDSPNERVTVRPPLIPDHVSVFLVPDWDVQGSHHQNGSFSNEFPSINLLGFIDQEHSFIAPQEYIFVATPVTPDYTDASGIPGQGDTATFMNPASMFGDHGIGRVGTKYYDPSYGKIYNTLSEVDNSFQAFGILCDVVGQLCNVDEGDVQYDLDGGGVTPGNLVPTRALILKQNPTGAQIVELPWNMQR